MKYWAVVFFLLAIAFSVIGFGPNYFTNENGHLGIAKILFFVFSVLGAVSLIFGTRNIDEK